MDVTAKENAAALKIQSTWRGFKVRSAVKNISLYNKAALRIQKQFRLFRKKKILSKVGETIATAKITNAVITVQKRKQIRGEIEKLKKNDKILTYYPSLSKNNPNAKPRLTSSVNSKKKKNLDLIRKPEKLPQKSKNTNEKRSKANSRSIAIQRPSTAPPGTSNSRKRKTIIELPKPWKDKDPKRISQSQMDDLLFQQKSNVSWAKTELLPFLMRKCDPLLADRDTLYMKNEKYRSRKITKPFAHLIQREDHFLFESPCQSVSRIENSFIYSAVSARDIKVFRSVSSTNDKLVLKYKLEGTSGPLFDSIINPANGNVFGIDSSWNLCLFNGSRIVLKQKLEMDFKIPIGNNYLFFDKFGMLWVNLLCQKGNLLCVDPLTFETAVRVNYSIASKLHKYMRKCSYMFPIFFNDTWIGFAGSFVSEGVFLFTKELTSVYTLKSTKVNTNAKIKQIGNRLLVWSPKNMIVIYDIFDDIFKTKFAGYVNIKEPIVCVDGITEPDVFVVATARRMLVYLARDVVHLLTLPETKMSSNELKFAKKLLGPPQKTQSRKRFTLLCEKNTIVDINCMSISAISNKLALIVCSATSGIIGSLFLSYEPIQVEARSYDTYEVTDVTTLSNMAIDNFFEHAKTHVTIDAKKIEKFVELERFDAKIIAGQLSSLFLDKENKFSLVKEIARYDLSSNKFLPRVPPNCMSLYEIFHFFKRADILPDQINAFSEFLRRFSPEKLKRDVTKGYLSVEKTLPVQTGSFYNAITDQFLNYDEIKKVIDNINPINNLRKFCPEITISSIDSSMKKRLTLKEQIYKEYQRHELNQRISKLTKLEDLVKHEILRRMLDEKSEEINNKKQAAESDENDQKEDQKRASRKPASNDINGIDFYPTPNRNPLLDEIRHKSIYECWAEKIMFGMDPDTKTSLQKLILKREFLDNEAIYDHFKFVQKLSQVSRKIVSSKIYHYTTDIVKKQTHIVITQNNNALPLSHYLTIHSFLGSSGAKLLILRSILSRVLTALNELHKNGVICRTIHPSNIFLDPMSNSITIGSVYDCQYNSNDGKTQVLPLPPKFAVSSNPFLPPEYYHKPSREHTQAFDVWQFGVLLLYMLTGSLPPSYGSELLARIPEQESRKKVRFTNKKLIEEAPLYPDVGFFYDWMKGVTIVPPTEMCIGECGESFFVSNTGKPGTSLDIQHYKVLPFLLKEKNSDSHLIIDIIALCLQLDPTKRPTVQQLLNLNLFSMIGQSREPLENYMTTPDPRVFVSQFFSPVLDAISSKNFNFAMGIITALLFSDDLTDDEIAYSFPLQKPATLKVIAVLFQNNFIDTIIKFLIDTLSKEITKEDVAYGSTYSNDMFNSVVKFYDKFLKTVEHGQGPLMIYVNDIVQSLYGLYACNPFLRHDCALQLVEENEYYKDSCCLFIFMHNHLMNLVLFAAQGSSYIANRLKKTNEHSDAYFEQFINFSNTVYSLAYSVVFGNEKQKSNNIKNVVSFWNGGQSLPIVRLFVDFKVVQKILQCITFPSARTDATTFFIAVAKVFKTKDGIKPVNWLANAIKTPIVRVACNTVLRDPASTDGMKQPVLEVMKHMTSFRTEHDLISLFTSELFQFICEQGNNALFLSTLEHAVDVSQPLLTSIILQFVSIQRMFSIINLEYVPKLDMRIFNDTLDIFESIILTKRLCMLFGLRNSTLPAEIANMKLPFDETVEFIIKTLDRIPSEAMEMFTIDGKPLQRSDSKIKKEVPLPQYSAQSKTLFHFLFILFKNLMKTLHNRIPANLFDFICEKLKSDIKHSSAGELPSVYAHICMQKMALFTIKHMRTTNPAMVDDINNKLNKLIETFEPIIFRDTQWMSSVTASEITMHIVNGYVECKENRMQMLHYILRTGIKAEKLIKYIVHTMVHNTTTITVLLWKKMRMKYQYPIREEAQQMVAYILQSQTAFDKFLADEIEKSNFIENERKITDLSDNEQLVRTSLKMFASIINRNDIFSLHFIKQCQSMVEALVTRFHRDWVDMPFLDVLLQTVKQNSRKNKGKNKGTSYKADSWRRPITTLNGNPSALVFAPGSRPTTVLH